MTKKKVQIIGRVTGINPLDAKINFKFTENALVQLGYNVINTTTLIPIGTTNVEAIRMSLRTLLDVDTVCIQRDWIDCRIAQNEYLVATALQLEMIRI